MSRNDIINTDGTIKWDTVGGFKDSIDSNTAQLADIAIDVKNYGAVADGVTDSATAFNNAIAALPSSGGKIIFNGKYVIKSSIVVNKPIIFEGNGIVSNTGSGIYSGSHIIKDGSFDGVIVTSGGAILRCFTIEGAAGNGGNGITIKNGRVKVESVTTASHGGDGIRVGDNAGANCNMFWIRDVIALGNKGNGIHIEDATNPSLPNCNTGLLESIDARSNTGDGILLKSCYANTLINISAQSNTGYGLHIASNANTNFALMPYCEANTAGQIILDASSNYNKIFGDRMASGQESMTDNGTQNFLMGSSNGDVYIHAKTILKKLGIQDGSITGSWEGLQDSTNRDLIFQLIGTSSKASVSLPQLKVGGGTAITGHLMGGGTLSFGSIPANSSVEKTLTVTGSAVYDGTYAYPNGSPELGLVWNAYVSATDTVTIRLTNITTTSITTASRGWRVDVWKH